MRRSRVSARPYFHLSYRKSSFATGLSWRNVRCDGRRENVPRIFIGARYGLETVGNRLILLGLLRSCRLAGPQSPVFILSSLPAATEATLREIAVLLARAPDHAGLMAWLRDNVRVLPEAEVSRLGPGDLLLIGGGPINDNCEIVKLRCWAAAVRRAGGRTIIAGCGVGPLRIAAARTEAAKLFACSDIVMIRNRPSPEIDSLLPRGWQLVPDPSLLCRDILRAWIAPKKPVIALNGRSVELDCRLDGELSKEAVIGLVVQHAAPVIKANGFRQILPYSSLEWGVIPDSSIANGAARILARRFDLELLAGSEATLPGMVEALSSAEAAISVRHHGFLIALMLGCRSLVLDYTDDVGKSGQFLRDWLKRENWPSLFSEGNISGADLVDPSELDSFTGEAQRPYTAAIASALSGASRD